MLRKIFISISFVLLALAPTLAADPPELIGGSVLPGVENQIAIQENTLGWLQNTFLKNTIDLAIGFVAALAVIFLIVGGYQYLTAVGGEEQIKAAHKTIAFALVGLLLALFAFAIVQIVVNIQFEKADTSSSVQSDFDAINAEIEENQKENLIQNINDANSFNSANLLAADVAEVLPFAESEWDAVPEIQNLPTADFQNEFLPIVARFLIFGMASASFLVFIFAGVWFIIGWGEEAAVKKAKNAIIWSITGLAVAALSYALVKGLLGVEWGWN